MKADWALAIRQALPKNLVEYNELQQNELLFDNNSRPAGINSFNFIRYLQWNNMEKEIEAIPVSIFRFWDQKEMKEKLFSLHGDEFIFYLFNPQTTKHYSHDDSNDKNKVQNGQYTERGRCI